MKINLLENNYLYFGTLCLMVSICTILNYDANVMGPMVVLYEDFARFINFGFDLSYKFKYSQYTFPMWGYGFVIFLFKRKLYIIVLQQILTIVAIFFLDYVANKFYLKKSKLLLRGLLLISFPWFFFHTSLWPYSFGANLLIIAICFTIWFYEERSNFSLYISALCFGVMLNFRSDYYYFVFIVYVILFSIIFLVKKSKFYLNRSSLIISFLLVNICLIPWGIYTKKRVGHYLQTSTNAGHVFFISLGQLPNNVWHITQEDNDPTMYKELSNEFRRNSNLNSLAYNEDKFLARKWLSIVLLDKKEYFKKCIYNIYRIIRTPFYVGNLETLFNISNSDKFIVKEKIKIWLDSGEIDLIIKYVFFGAGRFYLVSLILNIFSILFFLTFIFYFIKSVFIKSNYTDFKSLFLLVLVGYQNLMSIFVFYMPIYNTNIYLIYLLLLVYFREKIIFKTNNDKEK